MYGLVADPDDLFRFDAEQPERVDVGLFHVAPVGDEHLAGLQIEMLCGDREPRQTIDEPMAIVGVESLLQEHVDIG